MEKYWQKNKILFFLLFENGPCFEPMHSRFEKCYMITQQFFQQNIVATIKEKLYASIKKSSNGFISQKVKTYFVQISVPCPLSREYNICRAGSGCGHLPPGDTSPDCHTLPPLKGLFCLQGWEWVWPPACW